MKKLLLTSFLVLIPLVAAAQQGRVLFDLAVQFDFELPPGREDLRDQIPSESITSMVLFFNASESLMKAAPSTEGETPSDVSPRMQGYITRLKMGSGSRSDNETLLETYVNHDDGTVAESRDFMGRTFLISGTQPTYAWRLAEEQSKFLGFMVQKATVVQDSTAIEAWFTPEIPVSAGPGLFGGLPGMILVVSVDDGHRVYTATAINLDGLENDAIKAPEDGREVSRDEYEQIVAEKLEEVAALRKSRERRGGRDRNE